MMLPIIAVIHIWHIWLSPINQYSLKKWKFPYFFWWKMWKKNKRDPVWNKIKLCYLFSLSQERKRWIDVFFFIGFGSIGTDGARTRSFRLDRAVLWPIELQSRGNQVYNICCWFNFLQTFLCRFLIRIVIFYQTETRVIDWYARKHVL